MAQPNIYPFINPKSIKFIEPGTYLSRARTIYTSLTRALKIIREKTKGISSIDSFNYTQDTDDPHILSNTQYKLPHAIANNPNDFIVIIHPKPIQIDIYDTEIENRHRTIKRKILGRNNNYVTYIDKIEDIHSFYTLLNDSKTHHVKIYSFINGKLYYDERTIQRTNPLE